MRNGYGHWNSGYVFTLGTKTVLNTNPALFVNITRNVEWKLESQLTFLQGPLPLSLHACCKCSGDTNGHEGEQTSAPVGESTSYLKWPRQRKKNDYLDVFTIYKCAWGLPWQFVTCTELRCWIASSDWMDLLCNIKIVRIIRRTTVPLLCCTYIHLQIQQTSNKWINKLFVIWMKPNVYPPSWALMSCLQYCWITRNEKRNEAGLNFSVSINWNLQDTL